LFRWLRCIAIRRHNAALPPQSGLPCCTPTRRQELYAPTDDGSPAALPGGVHLREGPLTRKTRNAVQNGGACDHDLRLHLANNYKDSYKCSEEVLSASVALRGNRGDPQISHALGITSVPDTEEDLPMRRVHINLLCATLGKGRHLGACANRHARVIRESA